MNFFQHQEQARKRTTLLIVLYALAVVLLIGAVYVLVVFLASMVGGEEYAVQLEGRHFLSLDLIVLTVGGVMLLVLGGSAMKIAQLSAGGGKSVAEMMGGRQISPSTIDPAERRLFNVVEEMALASGIPIPGVYVMDNEPGINAFAAGFSPNEAVIGVNRGTMDLLTRDELQGVIAHEFSHILNGDMRMNLRLIGVLFGLQLLALIGYYCLRLSFYASSGSSSRSGNDGNQGNALGLIMLLGGLGVMVIGYVGMFFSALIKAAISRQREFLADASAVQFTRNPDGISGALKKIGCPKVGSEIHNEHAAEASHLFFGNVCQMFSLGTLLATHPDLTTRIRRIDPKFDGRFPSVIFPVNIGLEKQKPKSDPRQAADAALRKLNPLGAIDGMGELTPGRVLAASALLGGLPTDLSEESRDPLTAKAMFYAILLDRDPAIQRAQLNILAASETDFTVQKTRQFQQQLDSLSDRSRIPLAQRILSSLRQLSSSQYQNFSTIVDHLIAADQKMSLFEYTLKAILLRDLDIHFGMAKPLAIRYKTIESVKGAFIAVLSYLAYSGHDSEEATQAAFTDSQKLLKLNESILPVSECSVVLFDRSLRTLAETTPTLKEQVFTALMNCVHHDGRITDSEGELIRAIAAMLAIPMPNFDTEGTGGKA